MTGNCCKAIVTTFDLLVEQVVRDKPGIQETEFTLIYNGAVIGLGYISSVMSHAGNNGVGGIARISVSILDSHDRKP